MTPTTRHRDRRLEVRMTDEERTLVDRAVDVEGTDLTSFAVMHLVAAARAVLADRNRFVLSDATREAWEQ